MKEEIIIKNEKYYEELKKTINEQLSEVKNKIYDFLDTVKFLILHNKFKCAEEIVFDEYDKEIISSEFEKILKNIRRFNNEY